MYFFGWWFLKLQAFTTFPTADNFIGRHLHNGHHVQYSSEPIKLPHFHQSVFVTRMWHFEQFYKNVSHKTWTEVDGHFKNLEWSYWALDMRREKKKSNIAVYWHNIEIVSLLSTLGSDCQSFISSSQPKPAFSFHWTKSLCFHHKLLRNWGDGLYEEFCCLSWYVLADIMCKNVKVCMRHSKWSAGLE